VLESNGRCEGTGADNSADGLGGARGEIDQIVWELTRHY
jgi:hypothetical protein